MVGFKLTEEKNQIKITNNAKEKMKPLISPVILELKRELKSGNKSKLSDFWLKIEKNGTPLIDKIENDINHKLVTFIVRANKETKNAVVICSLADQDDVVSNNVCEQVENTDVLYKSFIVLNGTRTVYTISENNTLRYRRFYDNLMQNLNTLAPDPYNPKRFIQRYRREGKLFVVEYSVLELPDAKPEKWIRPNENAIPGNLKSMDFYSRILKTNKKIWVYTPHSFNIKAEPYHFLIIFDGKAFLEFTQAPTIFDNLQGENKIPPIVAVFIHNYSGYKRSKDLSCYPLFADFIAKELVPWARENYNISSNPAHAVLIGSSSGGLTASFIGFKYPETFRNILSQSGYYAWYPGYSWFQYNLRFYGDDYVRWWSKEEEKEEEWLTQQFLHSKQLPLKFYVNVGNLETRAIQPIRNFRKMLQDKEYDHLYEEYPGGHEYIAWREYLPDGLIYLIGY